MMRRVDIIIPIYNAFEDLQICLESLYKHTDLQKNRLILINDNSPDERIRPFLDVQEKENVIVIHNTENKGFSNNINIGMSQSSDNDVILLNSDTILTKGWVEKIVACAYSKPEIGTVTPLSNNATLCSVPDLFEENVLPEWMSVDKAADIVEACSLRKYPRITVAHGFCMLVKREVINLIGNFDAETFGRGYGEENDFCNRAEQMGYIHVMCDDTYIYHSGTKSFVSKEKAKYIEEHQKILYDRYPKQMKANERHVQGNPNKLIGENVRRFLDIYNGKQNILYWLHYDFREGTENNVGGTQMHVQHLVEGLRHEKNVFVAARSGEYLEVTAYVNENEYTYRFFIGEKEEYFQYRNSQIATIAKNILSAFRIDLVHIHHVQSTSLDIFYEAKKANIPIVFTIHDFYSVCPDINLYNCDKKLCDKKENNICKECLEKKKNIYKKNPYIDLWRKNFAEVMELCDLIITPSNSTKGIINYYIPEMNTKVQVVYHGLDWEQQIPLHERKVKVDNNIVLAKNKLKQNNNFLIFEGNIKVEKLEKETKRAAVEIQNETGQSFYIPVLLDENNHFKVYIPNKKIESEKSQLIIWYLLDEQHKVKVDVICWNYKKSEEKNKKFNVAFIGGMSDLKGAKIAKEIVSKSNKQVDWYVFGNIGDEQLIYYENEQLIKVGKYCQKDLKNLLKAYEIDAICLLAVWPETFSYTLSEAFECEIPVIVTNIGALAERVSNEQRGKVVSVENAADEALQIIYEWASNSEIYEVEKEKCKTFSARTIKEMCQEYLILYEGLVRERKVEIEEYNKELLWQGMLNTFSQIAGRSGNQGYDAKLAYMELVMDSITWKLVTKLINMKFPFKDRLYMYLTRDK